jgi:hypothetical protein
MKVDGDEWSGHAQLQPGHALPIPAQFFLGCSNLRLQCPGASGRPSSSSTRLRARLAPADSLLSFLAGRSLASTSQSLLSTRLASPTCRCISVVSRLQRISCCWVVVEAETGLPNHSGLKMLRTGAAQDSSAAATRLEVQGCLCSGMAATKYICPLGRKRRPSGICRLHRQPRSQSRF